MPLASVLRTLILARLLWGDRARLSVPELSRSLGVPEPQLRRALYLLYRVRWVWFDSRELAVGLTREGEEYFMSGQLAS
jgi:DNA-binding IclR family transcriptional regulator